MAIYSLRVLKDVNGRTILILLAIATLTALAGILANLTLFSELHRDHAVFTKLYRSVSEFAGSMNKEPFTSTPLIVHYVIVHDYNSPESESSLTFVECLSVLSVMKNLSPDLIYIHSNLPDYWPFQTCEPFIHNWTSIRLITAPRKFSISGQKVRFIQHEVDMKKLEVLREHGGLALDFDVYLINGEAFRELYSTYPCIICADDGPSVNGGFLACRKGAKYPRMVLEKSYFMDYRPDALTWNSGDLPYKLLEQHNDTASIVEGICNTPNWIDREDSSKGADIYDWTYKIAHRSYFHNRTYSVSNLETENTTLSTLLSWILYS